MAAVTTDTRHGRDYLALGLMYVAQGIPAGLAFDALGVLIRHGGHGVAEVGLVGLAFLPWALKALWAGPVDNACLRWGFTPVILATQGAMALVCLGLAPFPPDSRLHAALAGVLLLNTLSATQDIATNAYAVTRLQGRAAGPANGVQIAGFITGMMVGGGGALMLHPHLGWAGLMAALALLLPALYLPLLVGRGWRADAERRAARAVQAPVRLRDLARHADLTAALAVAVLFKFPSTAASTLAKPWMIDRGLSLPQAGMLQAGNLALTAAGAVLLGVPLIRRFGVRRAVALSGGLAMLLLGAGWALESGGVTAPAALYAGFGAQSFAEGAFYVAIWTLFMNWASRERPGTDYTAMQSCESVANAVAASVVGALAQGHGYAAVFAGAWIAGAVALLAILGLLPRLSLAGDGMAGDGR